MVCSDPARISFSHPVAAPSINQVWVSAPGLLIGFPAVFLVTPGMWLY